MKKIMFVLAGISMFFAFNACDLNPEIYSEYDREGFESAESAFDPKLGDVYVNLQREYGYVYREGFWSLQENTTDECVVPTRYMGDWLDGNIFWILHNHRFDSKTREISKGGQSGNNAWAFAYRGITKCNSMMKWMRSTNLDVKRPADMAELYIFRAWYHYLMLDNFGNVQFVSQLGENGYEAKQGERHEIFDSIMVDLHKYVPQAREEKIYSRVNKHVGWMVLAKMYLNAEAWGVVGKAKYAPTADECYKKAALYCDSIINSKAYSLTPNYFDNFLVENQGSTENIWCVFYDASFSMGMQFHQMTLHYASQNSYGLKNQPWNGYCTTHKVLGLYGEGDTRINCWERGQQYNKSGAALTVKVPVDSITYVLMPQYVRKPVDWPATLEDFAALSGRDTVWDTKADTIKSIDIKPYTFTFPAVFTDTITTLTNNTEFKIYNIFEGARFVKFQIQEGVGDHMSNDFPIYRLADVYLMKAEAEMRANGGVANDVAVAAANKVRQRAGATPYSTATLTLDELCNERCRELMWEGHRRQDLIRFDRFTGANSVQNDDDPYNLWVLKYSTAQKTDDLPGQVPYRTPAYMKVFPLPDYVVTNGFTQNPGYRE
ncbi:MAG: RagB/SusD family nutrient uptake outer membrane protein [Paludibacteraceae bacterium]|nr:RagB/SusD family nutrient uptake outer membrane protein [Paludibacteraceae bacterium]